MSKTVNPERCQDAPLPTDQSAWSQSQGYQSRPLAPGTNHSPKVDRLFTNIELPPKSNTTRPDDRGKQHAPPELIVEDRDRDRNHTTQSPSAEDREQTRQRPPAEVREQTQQHPPTEDREQTGQRPIDEDRE